MELRVKINQLIDDSGLSIRQLAEESGVRRQSIMHFLKGGNIHIKNLQKILETLGHSLAISEIKIKENSVSHLPQKRLNLSKKQLTKFCQKYGIVYLALFGSVLRNDFDKDSDIDVLIKLNRDISFFELLEIEEELKKLFKTKHRIDLLTEGSVSPLIKDEIAANHEVIYEKAA